MVRAARVRSQELGPHGRCWLELNQQRLADGQGSGHPDAGTSEVEESRGLKDRINTRIMATHGLKCSSFLGGIL